MINGWNSFYNVKPIIEYDFDHYKITFPLKSDGKVDGKVDANVDEKVDANVERQCSPSSRRNWILKELRIKEEIRRIEIQKAFNLGKQIVALDLKTLINEGKIKKCGGGSNVWYELK
jgi:predicted HTH transcriptional regulator